MTEFMRNQSLGAICDRVVGGADPPFVASAGHFVVVRCPFSKIRVDWESARQRGMDGGRTALRTMEGRHEAERVRGRFCSLLISPL